MQMSENAHRVLEARYLRRDRQGQICEMTLTRFRRVREEKSDKLYRGGHPGQNTAQLYQRIKAAKQ